MEKKTLFVAAAGLILAGGFGLALGGDTDPAETAREAPAEAGEVVVYKSPACGCCGDWVDHLRSAGFDVRVEDRNDVYPIKAGLGVPGDLSSCHTAVVEGYVLEGHVPASDVRRLLEERPDVVGIAVPGMPMGSPGMEGPREERYSVVAFDGEGGRTVFARH